MLEVRGQQALASMAATNDDHEEAAMLKVTDAAVEQLNAMLENANTEQSQGIRLIESESGLGLQIDMPQPGDQIVGGEERPVLIVAPDLSDALDGALLDTVSTPDGNQFKLVGAAEDPPQNGTH